MSTSNLDKVTRTLSLGVSERELQALKDEADRQQVTMSQLVRCQVELLQPRKTGRPKKN
jgi:hypothetical protein